MDLIWQPVKISDPHHDFEILLNTEFARRMYEKTLTLKQQQRYNMLGEEFLKKYIGYQPSPYLFHENTAFVRQFSINGGNGQWLELEGMFGELPNLYQKEPLVYTSKEMDSITDAYAIWGLIDIWVKYSKF